MTNEMLIQEAFKILKENFADEILKKSICATIHFHTKENIEIFLLKSNKDIDEKTTSMNSLNELVIGYSAAINLCGREEGNVFLVKKSN